MRTLQMINHRFRRFGLEGDGEEQLPYDVETDTVDYDDLPSPVNADALVYSLKDDTMPDNQFIQEPALTDVRAIQDTTNTLRDAVEAGEYQDAADESDSASSELQNVRDIVEEINSNESWTPGSIALLGNHLDAITQRLGIRPIRIGVDMEDGTAWRRTKTISVEDIQAVIDAVDSSTEVLQERSVEALEQLLQSLGESVPRLASRLVDLCRKTEGLTNLPEGQVTLTEPCLVRRLSVNGKFPESFPQLANDYTSYGLKLLGSYTETAFQSAMRLNVFESNFTQYSANGFWALIEDRLKQIVDPRKVLTESQMTGTLPGAGSLFGGPGEVVEEVIPAIRLMRQYVSAFKPVSIADFSKDSTESEPSSENEVSVKAITVTDINDTVKFLCDLIRQTNLTAVSQSCKAAWLDAKRTICSVKKQLSSADDTFVKELNTQGDLLPTYLETVFALSAWPVLNYLTNLVLFGNAFVDYATLSINPERIQAATVTPEESNTDDASSVSDSDSTSSSVDTGTTVASDTDPALEPTEKPTSPDEVPDTGTTPDEPQDATGDGERAVVVDVGVSDSTSGDESDGDDGTVDVSKPDSETSDSTDDEDTSDSEGDD